MRVTIVPKTHIPPLSVVFLFLGPDKYRLLCFPEQPRFQTQRERRPSRKKRYPLSKDKTSYSDTVHAITTTLYVYANGDDNSGEDLLGSHQQLRLLDAEVHLACIWLVRGVQIHQLSTTDIFSGYSTTICRWYQLKTTFAKPPARAVSLGDCTVYGWYGASRHHLRVSECRGVRVTVNRFFSLPNALLSRVYLIWRRGLIHLASGS